MGKKKIIINTSFIYAAALPVITRLIFTCPKVIFCRMEVIVMIFIIYSRRMKVIVAIFTSHSRRMEVIVMIFTSHCRRMEIIVMIFTFILIRMTFMLMNMTFNLTKTGYGVEKRKLLLALLVLFTIKTCLNEILLTKPIGNCGKNGIEIFEKQV